MKKETFEIKNRWTGKVLFTYESDKETNIKEALEQAVNEGANLEGANLEGAYLRGAYLVQIVGLGSVGRCTTFDLKNKKVLCGCWYGSFKEFKARVNEEYIENDLYKKQYLSALSFIESLKL